MAVIIDRRLNPKGKNHINRQKFLDRARERIKEAVKKSVTDNKIKDIGSGEKVRVRSKDVSEPNFQNDPKSGDRRRVLPGNDIHDEGDLVPKPYEDESPGSGPGTGESMDDFEFALTREEFLNYLFEDLELPDFVKESMKVTDASKYVKSGMTNSGSPANLNIEKSFKKSIGRRLALHRPTDEEIAELEDEIKELELKGFSGPASVKRTELEALKNRQKTIPFIDENDLRYTHYDLKPTPSSQAVMFCLMDVSGSMGEKEKDISKRFFLLLYLFLEKKYDKIDIRFIRHTEVAEEVDEETFFYDRQSGGTLISSGLFLINDIIDSHYHPADWNIYIAQCTDGDNVPDDNVICKNMIENKLQKIVQYYAYIQISEPRPIAQFLGSEWSAFPMFKQLSEQYQNIECRRIANQDQIWTVFRSLFEKKAITK